MQYATVMVALGGDRNSTIQRHGVTPLELKVLQALHNGEVFNIQLAGEVERDPGEELDRLRTLYRAAIVNKVAGDPIPFVPDTFAKAGVRNLPKAPWYGAATTPPMATGVVRDRPNATSELGAIVAADGDN